MANHPMVLAVINESSRLSDAEIATHIAAVQEQMDSDVGPAWKFRVQLRQIPTGDPPPANQSWMVYLDNTEGNRAELPRANVNRSSDRKSIR
jgi:hypothetical protein